MSDDELTIDVFREFQRVLAEMEDICDTIVARRKEMIDLKAEIHRLERSYLEKSAWCEGIVNEAKRSNDAHLRKLPK